MQLIRYEAARRALAEAVKLDEVKELRDKAEALRVYAQQAKDSEMETMAAKIKLRAQRRLGELSAELERAANHHQVTRLTSETSKAGALREAGIARATAHRYEQIASIPEEAFEEYIETKSAKGQAVSAKEVVQMVGKRARRKERVETLQAKNMPLPTGGKRYHVIYADPPWKYHNVLSDSRLVENHYPTLSLDEIKALPVDQLAAEDAVLWLWATSPGLEEALEVMRAWRFIYRSCAVWVKPSIGAGFWFRQRHELLLLGVRGDMPVPMEADRPDSVIEASRGKHSEKPEQVYSIIDRAFPEFTRIELFARSARAGWDAWGNQVD